MMSLRLYALDADALSLVLLIRDDEPLRYERAAVRWLGRYTADRFEHSEIDRMEGYLDTHFGADRERTFAYRLRLPGRRT